MKYPPKYDQFFGFLTIFEKIWPWPSPEGQGHRHLGHWMRLIRLYLATKYEMCRWNSLRDMTSSLVFHAFWGKFDLDLWPWPWVKVIGIWVIECALLSCILVLNMKSVGEIASEIWPVLCLFMHFWENLTLTFDLDRRSRSSALGSMNAPYWVVPLY